MGLFDLFGKKKNEPQHFSNGSYFETSITDAELQTMIPHAIAVFEESPHGNDQQIIDKIKAYTKDEPLAEALYRFIPIAYCRLIFPEPSYSDEYILRRSAKDEQSYKLSADKIYQAVAAEAKNRFSEETPQDKIVNILMHSADFNAINQALNNGSQLTDLVASPTIFVD